MPRNRDEAELAKQTAQANQETQAFLDREARGLDPITGAPATGRPAVPWMRGNRETWILALIADYERHFQKTANAWFVLAAYDASSYLCDRVVQKDAMIWIDIGIRGIVRQLLAGGNPLPKRARQAMRKTLQDGALCLTVITCLPSTPGRKETSNAVSNAAKAHGVSDATGKRDAAAATDE